LVDDRLFLYACTKLLIITKPQPTPRHTVTVHGPV